MTDNQLTCSFDGANIEKLAKACGIDEANMHVMLDEECTYLKVERKIREIGESIQKTIKPGDVFVYYYSGHGTNLKDKTGDEADGEDEALCFVTPDGQVTLESCMVDDDFAKIITSSIPPECLVVVLTDCCHSATMCDFENPEWTTHTAVSIAGCLDSQTSGDVGNGGIFTHSLLLGIDKLLRAGDKEFSVGKLYNATLAEDEAVFNSKQDITIKWTANTKPDAIKWPLIPVGPYKAPLSQAAELAAGSGPAAPGSGTATLVTATSTSTETTEGNKPDSMTQADFMSLISQLQQLGVPASIVQCMTGKPYKAITTTPEDYLRQHGAELVDMASKASNPQLRLVLLGAVAVVVAVAVGAAQLDIASGL